MGSADTGAREPLELAEIVKRHMTTVCLCEWDDSGTGDLVAESHECSIHGEGERPLEALEELAALAAGVGVPPDEESVSAPAKERQDAQRAYWRSLLADTAIALRAQNLSREQVAGAIERALEAEAKLAALAGVGEARPAEPADDDIRICLQPKHRELEAECGRLRERVRELEFSYRGAHLAFLHAEKRADEAEALVSALREERGDARELDLKKFSAWLFFSGFIAGIVFDSVVRWLS